MESPPRVLTSSDSKNHLPREEVNNTLFASPLSGGSFVAKNTASTNVSPTKMVSEKYGSMPITRDPLMSATVQQDKYRILIKDQYMLYPVRLARLQKNFLTYGQFYPFAPQSGKEKRSRREKYEANHAFKTKKSKQYEEHHKTKNWTPEQREQYLKEKESLLFVSREKSRARRSVDIQSGLENLSLDSLKSLLSLQGLDLPEYVGSKIEGVMLLAITLFEATSYSQALGIFLLYLKSHYSESLTSKAASLFQELFEGDEDFVEPQASKPQWLVSLREVVMDWRLLRSNPIFKKISYLISICITLGLCDAANFEWTVKGVKLFHIPSMDKHFTAFDLIDAAIETTFFFIEGGYACFSTKSIKPIFYSDIRAREFEEDYTELVANFEHVSTGNLLKLTGMREHDYEMKLLEVLETAQQLYDCAQGSWEKKILHDRLQKLKQVRASFDAIRVQGGLKERPFAVNFFGKSGVGKSSVSLIAMVVGLLSNGYRATDDVLVTLNEGDKYLSNYRSHVNGIFLDDIGNTKSDFVEKSPTQKIIEICNNVRQYANMAEAHMKGRVALMAVFLMLTTNVKDMCANTYSNEPVSVAGRPNMTVTVRVRPEFCTTGLMGSVGQQLDANKVAAHYTNEEGVNETPLIPDLWLLDCERVVPVTQGKGITDTIGYEPMKYNGKEMMNVSIFEFLDMMIDMSRAHFKNQAALVERSNNLSSKLPFCEECKRPQELCKCENHTEEDAPDAEDVDPQVGFYFGTVLGAIAVEKMKTLTDKAMFAVCNEGLKFERIATKKLLEISRTLEESPYYRWTNYIPAKWLRHKYGKQFITYAMKDDIAKEIRRESINLACVVSAGLIVPLLISWWVFVVTLPLIACLSYRFTVVIETVKERCYAEIVERSDAMPETFRKVRDKSMKYVLAALGSFAVIYTALKVWQGFRASTRDAQGKLAPTCDKDIDDRDAEVSPWASYDIEPIPRSHKQDVATLTEMQNSLGKNMYYLRVQQGEGVRTSGMVGMRGNVVMMPLHMWYKDGDMTGQIEEELKCSITKTSKSGSPVVIEAPLSRSFMEPIENTDMCIVWHPAGGEHRDIAQFLPQSVIKAGQADVFYCDPDGSRKHAKASVSPGLVGHKYKQFVGANTLLNIPTFRGLCMAAYCMQQPTIIAGFHLGGRTGTSEGVMGSVTQSQFEAALSRLSQKPGIVVAKSTGELKTDLYNKSFLLSTEIHPKCPTNYLPEGANFKRYGSCTGKARAKSSVQPTPISPIVEEVCGVPQKWGAPRFKPQEWKPYRESLIHSSRPSMGVEGGLLVKALKDYEADLLPIFRSERAKKEVKPLTKMQTVCGVDGRRFVDKMPPNTSVGFPLSGPKKEYLTLLDPAEYEDFNSPAELDPLFWDEAERMEQEYLKGRRAHPVFKACLKDEPTPLDKEKVRVFQSAPIALQLLVRKYFLPVARFLSLNPLLSECAVGINCQGPEWEELQAHISKYGADRILAGDYSKYDLRMPAQLIFTAFRILIDFAKETGNYTAEDRCIMEGVASDIAYPLMAYNGTLLQLIGSNPSGQNLTVYINSIANSLLFRCGFFHIYKEEEIQAAGKGLVSTFRDVCALGTYGDDAKSSVREGFDKFNHIAFAKFLEERDMKFTMPDKTSEPTPFMHDRDADFLKRKNVYCEEVGLHFGALDEESIFKSLHATLKSKVCSPEEVAANNIGGALREWFAHGRDVYEHRREQMQEVAKRAGLIVPEVHVPYEEYMDGWKSKYMETQCGVEFPTKDYEHVDRMIPWKCVACDSPVVVQALGEIDMLFRTTADGINFWCAVEVKASKACAYKARKQTRKNFELLRLCQPLGVCIAVAYDPRGFHYVLAHDPMGLVDWDELPFDCPPLAQS